MNSETDYTLCNLDSHHGYQSVYGSSADIYGFHSINGRGNLDTGQAGAASYYGGDASLSPQLGTPGELPLVNGGSQQMSGYSPGSVGVLTSRSTNRGHHQGGYPNNVPTSHHHHHQQQHHQHHQSGGHHHANSAGSISGGQHPHHPFTTHDLSMTTSTDCYPSVLSGVASHGGQQHSLTTAPNFLEIASVRSGYHTSGLPRENMKYGVGSPSPAHMTGSPVGLTNGYLPTPSLNSTPLKSEGCTNQQGVHGKPFRWMTIKRNPTKPGKSNI